MKNGHIVSLLRRSGDFSEQLPANFCLLTAVVEIAKEANKHAALRAGLKYSIVVPMNTVGEECLF